MDLQFILNTDNFINKFCVSDMKLNWGPIVPFSTGALSHLQNIGIFFCKAILTEIFFMNIIDSLNKEILTNTMHSQC